MPSIASARPPAALAITGMPRAMASRIMRDRASAQTEGTRATRVCRITSWMSSTGGMPAYTTSKAGVSGLTRGLARDLGPFNIRVNTVSPGWVMTERQKALWVTPEGERRLDEAQCLPGRLLPDDLARMVLFLAADDSRMCTAQNFIVDAGWV